MGKLETELVVESHKKGSIVYTDKENRNLLPSVYIPKSTLAELGGDDSGTITVTLERK